MADALERYERPLLRYATRFAGDPERARDVVQDTFLRLCEADPAVVDSHLAPWLYTVCRNRALDVRKKEARMTPMADTAWKAEPAPGPSPGDQAQGHEARGLVLDAVHALPERQQEAFRLKFQDGLSYREISDVMGVSLGTVSNWITTALLTLRDRLQPELNPAQEV